MPARSVLVCDPDDNARAAIEAALSRRFHVKVLSVKQSQLALALCRSRKPWVVLASVQQNQRDGFQLCGALRHLVGSRPCTMIAYGTQDEALDHRALAAKYKLDTWLPTAEPKMICRVLESKLLPKGSSAEAVKTGGDFKMRYQTFSAAREDPGEAAEEEPPDEGTENAALGDLDWSSLLRSDASLESLRAALTKNIHVIPRPRGLDEVDSPDELGWSELVRSEVRPAVLKALLTKEIRLRSDGAAGDEPDSDSNDRDS